MENTPSHRQIREWSGPRETDRNSNNGNTLLLLGRHEWMMKCTPTVGLLGPAETSNYQSGNYLIETLRNLGLLDRLTIMPGGSNMIG